MDERNGSEKLPQDAKAEFAEAAAKMQKTLRAAANEARQTVKTALHEAKRKTTDFETMYEACIRDKPSQAPLIAFGLGKAGTRIGWLPCSTDLWFYGF